MTTSTSPLVFNQTVYQTYAANRLKFLDETPGVGFMLSSPVPVITCTVSYLLFVCVLGPFLMRNREPYQLKNVIRFYNLLMVLTAAILFERIYNSIETFGSLFDCRKAFSMADQSGTKVYQMATFILLVRISEYFDTIFFTLRKKYNQVTFLHVFHHAFVPMYAFWILKTAPLRFNVYIILINSFIHVLMYFYYFLATFQTRDPKVKPTLMMSIINKLLMFKKYMTQLQILQFVSLGLYSIWAAVQPNSCNIPWTYILANFFLAFGFLSLFTHFYIKSYRDAAAAAAARSSAARAKTRRAE